MVHPCRHERWEWLSALHLFVGTRDRGFLWLASGGAIASRNSYRKFGSCKSVWVLQCTIVFGLCVAILFVDYPSDREIMLPPDELPTVVFALQHLSMELNTEASTLDLRWTGETHNAHAA